MNFANDVDAIPITEKRRRSTLSDVYLHCMDTRVMDEMYVLGHAPRGRRRRRRRRRSEGTEEHNRNEVDNDSSRYTVLQAI